jgi:hypothetical protein
VRIPWQLGKSIHAFTTRCQQEILTGGENMG